MATLYGKGARRDTPIAPAQRASRSELGGALREAHLAKRAQRGLYEVAVPDGAAFDGALDRAATVAEYIARREGGA
jgi:hypothetical protein